MPGTSYLSEIRLAMGNARVASRVMTGNPAKNRPPGRPKLIWEDKIRKKERYAGTWTAKGRLDEASTEHESMTGSRA